MLPPDYVTINQNFSPIPQIYTPNTTILTKKNFWKIFQFSRKTYIVCKIWTKMALMGFWGFTPWLCDNQSKFQSYSTNLHTEPYLFSQKEFLENFPVFKKNLHCVQILDKNGFAGILKCYPLIMWQSIKISVLFHKSTHTTLPFWLKRIFGKFLSSPENLHFVQILDKNGFAGNLKCYPLIMWQSIKISVLFHKSTHTTLPFWLKRIFGKFLSSPENLHFVQILDKNGFAGNLKCYPLIMWQSIKISVLFHRSAYPKLPFWLKEFLENFPVFQKNLHCVQNLNKNGFAAILKWYPLIMWQSIKISVLFHKSTHTTLLFQPKRNFGELPRFPETHTLCAKFEQKWFCWDFNVLPPHYVTINQNFNPIPQIYTPSTTILTIKNFWEKFPNFPEKLTLCAKFELKWLWLDFEVLPPDYVTINQNFSPIPQIYTHNPNYLAKKNF